jgi:UTP--glucose-1-phosphate uridylyltransferase
MFPAITKAVIPVAGFGTRLLPATKSIPKEMLAVLDQPAIQYIVDEAREAGIVHFVFVTGRNKSAIEDYFDTNFELEMTLRDHGKNDWLDRLARTTLDPGHASFTRQNKPLGLGHAIGCARSVVGDEPFAVLLPDMIMQSSPGCLTQMMGVYRERGGNVVALEQVDRSDVGKYGVVGFQAHSSGLLIDRMVEKPRPELAPSNHIMSGRYILQPRIFDIITTLKPGAGGEIQLTDAMALLLTEQAFWGFEFRGETFDCGDKLGLLLANIAYGLADESIGPALLSALVERVALGRAATLAKDVTSPGRRRLQ